MKDAAAKLSRQLNSRMSILHSMEPEVTAEALWLFDRENCPQLVSALQDVIERELRGQGSDPEGL